MQREWSRPATTHLLAAAVAGCALVALLFGSGRHVEWYLRVVYLLAPMGLAVMGALLVLRDHARGFAEVVAASPLTRADVIAGKVAFLVSFQAAVFAGALLPTFALMARFDGLAVPAWPGASQWRLGTYALVGMGVALLSACFGVTMGHAQTRIPRGAFDPRLGLAAGWALWFGLPLVALFLALRPERAATPVAALLKATPISSALDAVDLVDSTRRARVVEQLSAAGPLAGFMRYLGVAALAALVLGAFLVVHKPQGAKTRGGRIVMLLALPLLAAAFFGSGGANVADAASAGGLVPAVDLEDVVVRPVVTAACRDGGPLEIADSCVVSVVLRLTGQDAYYEVRDVALRGHGIAFGPAAATERDARTGAGGFPVQTVRVTGGEG
ncbi:MAG TPA: hypothetical protein VHH36_09140, partial [Candidatus Thermoplasmatota archaeon]|nr:hypothetical protein [Candidatus Thermoplasmatota archaeon]